MLFIWVPHNFRCVRPCLTPLAPSLPPRSGGEGGASPKRSEGDASGGGTASSSITALIKPPTPDPSPPFAARTGGGGPRGHARMLIFESDVVVPSFIESCFIVPGFYAAPGRRLFPSSPDKVRGMERQAAPLKSTPWKAWARPARTRAPPGAPRAAFFDPGPRFPGRFGRPDQPAPWRGDRSVPQAEPRAAPERDYEPRPEEPHPAPLK